MSQAQTQQPAVDPAHQTRVLNEHREDVEEEMQGEIPIATTTIMMTTTQEEAVDHTGNDKRL